MKSDPVMDPDLEPHIQEILEEVLEERDLDPDVAFKLVDRAQSLEGDDLNEALEAVLRRA